MRAIIIEEERFVEITQSLGTIPVELAADGYLCKHTNLTPDQIKRAADEIFRVFNYRFVQWAQSHGARCVR